MATIDLSTYEGSQKLAQKEFDAMYPGLKLRVGELQRAVRDRGVPVIVLFEGWYGSGISIVMNELNRALDARGFSYFATTAPEPAEKEYPFLRRFWVRTPPAGRIALFDRGWYGRTMIERTDFSGPVALTDFAVDEINSFERTLYENGTFLLKIFLHISSKEQKKRFKKHQDDPFTLGYIPEEDWSSFVKYNKYLPVLQDLFTRTDTAIAPWNIVDASDQTHTIAEVFRLLVSGLENALAMPVKENGRPHRTGLVAYQPLLHGGLLDAADLSLSLEKSDYERQMSEYGGRIRQFQYDLFRKKIPTIILFEGWDAAGKGGAIIRMAGHLNPRGYSVEPVGPPNDTEKVHHYLWRFHKKIPRDGYVTIFDRSWYGRVLVEKVEGLATPSEWKRAYREINEMEETFVRHGALLIKFWLHIDSEEQLARFRAREADPSKKWKITPEDWRNREKWDEYEEALREMFEYTSTPSAPWTVVEANNKNFSRVKVLKSVVLAMESRLGR
jgi:polyphosphate:AMP phosphotransferase